MSGRVLVVLDRRVQSTGDNKFATSTLVTLKLTFVCKHRIIMSFLLHQTSNNKLSIHSRNELSSAKSEKF